MHTGAFAIDTHTLYLEIIILMATVWPSGFGYSLYAAWRGRPPVVTTGLLTTLAIPFLFAIPAVWMLRPGIFIFPPPRSVLWGLAVILAPIGLLIEYVVHVLPSFRQQDGFRRKLAIHSLWRTRLVPADHILLAIIGIGEEIFYRLIWCSVLASLGIPVWWVLAISSAAYGVNHLALGPMSVISKTAVGMLYGSLYLFGGSIWLPITTHVLQNVTFFGVMPKSDG
jgi:membrane protease YdiL (CAAX protease family)